MLQSMTGFGRGEAQSDGVAVNAEIVGVNGRYLDISVRLPSEAAAMEIDLRRLVKGRVVRGRVSLSVEVERTGPSAPGVILDEETAEQYVAGSAALAERLGLRNDLTLTAVLNCLGVVKTDEKSAVGELERELIERAVLLALDEFQSMKRTEGKALAHELGERVESVRSALAHLEQRLPELNSLYAERLRAKLADIAADLSIKEERIAMEVAIMADKADVREEVVRLKSHLDQFTELLGSEGPVGRKLDFLVQEMSREANTIAAKNRDTTVTGHVLEVKAELEKIREQLQNVE